MADQQGAEFDLSERYRYRLWRSWGDGKSVTWIMLNPSTADAEKDDATIRRCINYARDWGYNGIEVVNLFAWRATDPKELYHLNDPIGPVNDSHITGAVFSSSLTICAWGNHGNLNDRGDRVLELIADLCTPMALVKTEQDQPGHPLRLAGDCKPFVWQERHNGH